MTRDEWRQFQRSIQILEPQGKRVPKPTAARWASFEDRWRLRLPSSYKAFVGVWGPGELSGYINVHGPRVSVAYNGLDGALSVIRSKSASEALAETYGDAGFVRRMFPFGDSIGGDLFVWDPADVRDARKHEYGIYALPSGKRRIVKLADSFPDFIRHVCFGKRFDRVFGSNWRPDKTFLPFSVPPLTG